jgi:hypothetical protein
VIVQGDEVETLEIQVPDAARPVNSSASSLPLRHSRWYVNPPMVRDDEAEEMTDQIHPFEIRSVRRGPQGDVVREHFAQALEVQRGAIATPDSWLLVNLSLTYGIVQAPS